MISVYDSEGSARIFDVVECMQSDSPRESKIVLACFAEMIKGCYKLGSMRAERKVRQLCVTGFSIIRVR